MAARTRKVRHDDFTRERIQTTQLVNRLTDHALGKLNLEPTQVRSIEILLRKSLPDLSSVEHSGGVTLSHEEMLDELDGSREGDQASSEG